MEIFIGNDGWGVNVLEVGEFDFVLFKDYIVGMLVCLYDIMVFLGYFVIRMNIFSVEDVFNV